MRYTPMNSAMPITFTCQATGEPIPTITWHFNNSELIFPHSEYDMRKACHRWYKIMVYKTFIGQSCHTGVMLWWLQYGKWHVSKMRWTSVYHRQQSNQATTSCTHTSTLVCKLYTCSYHCKIIAGYLLINHLHIKLATLTKGNKTDEFGKFQSNCQTEITRYSLSYI